MTARLPPAALAQSQIVTANGTGSPAGGRRSTEPARSGIHPLLAGLPFVAMAFVAVVDAMAGPEVGYLPLFSLGPAFACVTGTVRRAIAIGLVALALCVGAAAYDGLLTTHRATIALTSVLGATGAAVTTHRATIALTSVLGATGAAALAAMIRGRQERELAEVRSVAEAAQRVLLRPVPRWAGPMRVAVSYTSAVASARIGGDLYEVVPALSGTRVVVGDVQGKGLEAVETAALVLGAFREAAPEEPDLEAVGARLERALNRRLEGEEFVTAVLAEVGADHEVTLLVYGHPSPLLLRRDGTVEFAHPPVTAPPLGLACTGVPGPQPFQVELGLGDQMLFYTDGVSEARDRRGQFYPLAERAHLLRERDPDDALEALRRDLLSYTHGPLHDDAAMLLMRFRGARAEPDVSGTLPLGAPDTVPPAEQALDGTSRLGEVDGAHR